MSSEVIQTMSGRKRAGIALLWSAGWLIALLSVIAGVRNAIRYSQDFQWSPTRLLLQHVDPWKYALSGNPGHAIILSQGPNYAHFLYLLLAPLGWMSFPVARAVWAFCNLAFAGFSLILIRRIFQLTTVEWGITCIVFLCGTPFRNTVRNGQQPLIALLFVALAFSANDKWAKALFVGLSYCKYSFAPPYFFDAMFSRPYWIVVVTLIPGLIGLLWAYWMLGGHLLHLAVEPLVVGVTQNGSGTNDWMAVVDTYLSVIGRKSALFIILKYVLPILLSAFIAWHIKRRFEVSSNIYLQASTAIYGIVALALFRHLTYDFVFLVFALALSLKKIKQASARWLILGIAYFWFGEKVEDLLLGHRTSELLLLNFVILSSMLVAALRITFASSSSHEPADQTVQAFCLAKPGNRQA